MQNRTPLQYAVRGIRAGIILEVAISDAAIDAAVPQRPQLSEIVHRILRESRVVLEKHNRTLRIPVYEVEGCEGHAATIVALYAIRESLMRLGVELQKTVTRERLGLPLAHPRSERYSGDAYGLLAGLSNALETLAEAIWDIEQKAQQAFAPSLIDLAAKTDPETAPATAGGAA